MSVALDSWLMCRCCGRMLSSSNGLHAHLRGKHGLSAMEYYSKYRDVLRDRILEHTKVVQVVDGMTACWEWTGLRSRRGYGRMRVAGGPTSAAHRYAMFVRIGTLDDETARHRCDNPPCCNPEHLEPGSQLENVADRNERGRTATGNRTRSGQLTDEQVVAIRFRAEYLQESYRSIAEDYPIQIEAVRRVVLGTTYTNVTSDFIPW